MMGEFPASWVLLPVSDVVRNVTLTDKKIPQKSYLPSGKFPVFDQGQEYVGGYTDDAAMLVDCDLPVIVFGDHTRTVKLVNAPFAPGADGVKVLQPSACILPKLLENFVRYLVTKIPNNGYARHYQHLAKSLLPIPPLAEQHRIVAKIEELFSELDQGVASLKTAREQLKVYRQSLLKNAFEGKLTAAWRAAHRDQLETAAALQQRIALERQARYQQQLADWQTAGQSGPKPKPPKPLPPLTAEELAELPELPAGWGWAKLGALIDDPAYGTSKKCDYETAGVGVLRIPNVVSGKVDATDLKFAQFSPEEIAAYQLAPGDLLMIRSNGSVSIVGKYALVSQQDTAYLYAGYLIRLRPLQPLVLPAYLAQLLSAHELRKQIEHKAKSTSGVNNINSGEIQALVVPFCGLAEQELILQELESKLSEADQLDQTLATALQQADALRQSILKKAFCGQLVKQDKNEEPASTLLERIRAGKSNGIKKPVKQRKPG
ncbi:MAG: restriction endonuclease [Betaproteobacteria bacterium]|nr:restriction endonuclease [Betaproteobacteria bacterium]